MSNRMAEQIVELVSIPDVLRRYGYGLGRNKRIPCPLHSGKDSNFAYTDTVYHCWTCGASGNVISLVKELYGLNFGQALIKLNCDFGLGLTSKKPSYRDCIKASKHKKQKRLEWLEKQRKRQEYLKMCSLHRVLFRQMVMGAKIDGLSEYISNLELWLDEHIEEVKIG